ncbi:MAG TPA: class I SAM-dependent methyltransferase [Bacilli bacterium]|nr:class I SAM-dependent methyltransferase [Bacilli bacterium]
MKEEKIKKEVMAFWNDHFQNLRATAIKRSDITIDTPLDEGLQILADSCQEVLDIACGNGLCLIEAKLLGGKIKRGLGFDASQNAIANANQIVALSGIENLRFEVGDETFLASIEDESYEGIFCSNFLDVVPDKLALKVIKDIQRILKPGGLLLLKLNFYLSEDLITRLKMEKVDKDSYAINGVFRANNKTSEQWLNLFGDFNLLKQNGFQRAPGLPADRLFLLKKPGNC